MRFDARDLMITRLPIRGEQENSDEGELLSLAQAAAEGCLPVISQIKDTIDTIVKTCEMIKTVDHSDTLCQTLGRKSCADFNTLCPFNSMCNRPSLNTCGKLTDHCQDTCWSGRSCANQTCMQHTNCMGGGRTYCFGVTRKWCKDQLSQEACPPNGSKNRKPTPKPVPKQAEKADKVEKHADLAPMSYEEVILSDLKRQLRNRLASVESNPTVSPKDSDM